MDEAWTIRFDQNLGFCLRIRCERIYKCKKFWYS